MIEFHRTNLLGRELEYVQQAIASGDISGEGSFGRRCQEMLKELHGGAGEVLLTPSCTHALELSAQLLNVKDGDEVIMPSFTFVSTATAFAGSGARPIFADVDPNFLNISPDEIASLITPKTKAIVVVHYAGWACEMDQILSLAASRKIPVIEDAAHCLGGRYKDRTLGSLGTLGALSFHSTKNVSCGEGGALIVNQPEYLERAIIKRDKGTNREAFRKGKVPFYSWVDLGSSYSMSDVLSAFLLGQLEHLDEVLATRRSLVNHYMRGFRYLRDKGVLQFPAYPNENSSAAHLFFVVLESPDVRSRLQKHLQSKGIEALFHYQPLHTSPYVTSRWGKQRSLPITERAADCMLRLPLHNVLSEADVETVVNEIERFF